MPTNERQEDPLSNLMGLGDNIEKARRKARLKKSFPDYFVELFKDATGAKIVLQDFHREIIEAVESKQRVLITIFRGGGKSTLITVAYVSWYVGNNKDNRVVIACKNESLAKDFLGRIDKVLRSEAYQELFGNLVPPERSGKWNETEKIVAGRSEHAAGYTLFAIGAGGAAAGRRADLLVVDDCVDSKNSATEIQRQHLATWFFEELEPICEPTATAVVIGTKWGMKDLYSEVKEAWQGRFTDDKFQYILKPVLERVDTVDTGMEILPGQENGTYRSVWEERYSLEYLMNWWRAKPLEFCQQMLCNPVDSTLAFLQRAWLDQNLVHEDEIPFDRLTYYFGVDPAWSERKTSDYFAIAIGGRDEETGTTYLLDIVRDRADPDHSWKLIVQAANTVLANHKVFPALINMEANAAQSFLVRKIQENSALNINPVKTVGRKTERFTNMSVYFTTERVKIRAKWEDGLLVPYEKLDPFFYEWTVYRGDGSSDHDDCLDAVDLMLKAAAYGGEPIEMIVHPNRASSVAIINDNGEVLLPICSGCGREAERVMNYGGSHYCFNCMTNIRKNDYVQSSQEPNARLRAHYLR